MRRICISGPVLSGKTTVARALCKKSICNLTDCSVIDDSVVRVSSMYPGLLGVSDADIILMSLAFQIDRESITDTMLNTDLLFDRGVFDYLALLSLTGSRELNTNIKLVKSLLAHDCSLKYDAVYYMDLQDINIEDASEVFKCTDGVIGGSVFKFDLNGFKKHVSDYRVAFIEVMSLFRDIKVVPLVSSLSINALNQRIDMLCSSIRL